MKIIIYAAGFLLLLATQLDAGALTGSKNRNNYFWYYMTKKVVSECLGPEPYFKYSNLIEKYFTECYSMVSMGSNLDDNRLDGSISKIQKQKSFRNTPYFSEEKVRELKNVVLFNVKVVDCLFEKLELQVTANGTVDPTSFKDMTKDLNINAQLKNSILKGLDKCSAATGYGDFMDLGEKYVDFHKKLQFYRCSESNDFENCVKFDISKQKKLFDLRGLDGALSDLDDASKMVFVTSAYANFDTTGLWDISV